jgi:multicomponent Na+:H+ antiporter subunit D
MTAIGLKSAIMPVFSWLPRAHGTHSAPYIVSAILSGLYVKSSLYIFIRVQAIFSDVLGTQELFLLLGFMTGIIGLIVALSQTDIKLILAYSTISQLGLIIFGISLNTDHGYYGAIYHIFNHAIFKSTLFITAGLLIDHYNTRDITKMRGAFKAMPYVSLVMIVAILGITGAPLFNGSLSKYLIQKGTASSSLLETALILMNIGTLTYFIKFSTIFFGESIKSKFLFLHQKWVLGLLGLLCFLGGVGGHYFVGLFFEIKNPWQFSDYLEKFFIYGLSLTLAFLFYQYIYKKLRFFRTIQELELSFNELVFSISLFFVGILGYLLATVK